jgi:Cft2 family RNA processing exonuclease
VFELKQQKGVLVSKGKSVAVDPSRKSSAEFTFLSHGHSDHASVPKKSDSTFIVSKGTHSVLEEKFHDNLKVKKLSFGQKMSCGDFKLSLESAGHILGSSQAVFEDSLKLAVTNDFKLQDSLLFKGAKPIDCDLLVIESTFGLPEYVFPEREQVYGEMSAWLKQNIQKNKFVLLGGYSLGKAQELTRLVNEFTGQAPLVYETVHAFNEKYKREGVKLGDYIKLNHNLTESNVLVLPPHLIDQSLIQFLEHATKKKVVSAVATGWSGMRGRHKSFPLSDHADFKQLMAYIEAASPKKVFTVHGFEREFAHYIGRRLKIPAQPLSSYKQKNLIDFLG